MPNLAAENWKEQYYGKEGYKILENIKKIYDPTDFFYHSQSIGLENRLPKNIGLYNHLNNDNNEINVLKYSNNTKSEGYHTYPWESGNKNVINNCVKMYDKAANKDPFNFLDFRKMFSSLSKPFLDSARIFKQLFNVKK